MGDLVVLTIVGGGALMALKRPWVGAVLSIWISLMSPHIAFGWRLANLPAAQIVALPTLVGWLMTKDRWNPFVGAPVAWLMAFWVWICITLPFSFYPEDSLSDWERSMKIFLLVLASLALVNTRRKLEWMIAAVVISLGYYGVKGGVFTILNGGDFRVWGPGGFVEGNNELALALVMLLPLVRYLHLQASNAWARRAALGTLLILPLTILGSYSRGALIGLGAMAALLWLKSDRKVLGGIVLATIGGLVLAFMPEQWWERMDTIQSYQKDGSAMGRINAWWNAWNVATHNFFGGGFQIYNGDVFARYAPDPDDIHAAHSIYFQVLGEHGFIGLALFVAIGASTWLHCRKLIKASARDPSLKWAGDLGAMTQVSMVGYAVGGSFLSLAYFDLPYYQMAVVVIAHRLMVQQRQAAADAARPGLPEPTPPSALPASAPRLTVVTPGRNGSRR